MICDQLGGIPGTPIDEQVSAGVGSGSQDCPCLMLDPLGARRALGGRMASSRPFGVVAPDAPDSRIRPGPEVARHGRQRHA